MALQIDIRPDQSNCLHSTEEEHCYLSVGDECPKLNLFISRTQHHHPAACLRLPACSQWIWMILYYSCAKFPPSLSGDVNSRNFPHPSALFPNAAHNINNSIVVRVGIASSFDVLINLFWVLLLLLLFKCGQCKLYHFCAKIMDVLSLHRISHLGVNNWPRCYLSDTARQWKTIGATLLTHPRWDQAGFHPILLVITRRTIQFAWKEGDA